MTTVLAVLVLWTVLSAFGAAAFCTVVVGARRCEEQAVAAFGPVALAACLPRPRASAEDRQLTGR